MHCSARVLQTLPLPGMYPFVLGYAKTQIGSMELCNVYVTVSYDNRRSSYSLGIGRYK